MMGLDNIAYISSKEEVRNIVHYVVKHQFNQSSKRLPQLMNESSLTLPSESFRWCLHCFVVLWSDLFFVIQFYTDLL